MRKDHRRVVSILTVLIAASVALPVAGCRSAEQSTTTGGLHQAAPDVVGLTLEEASTRIGRAGYKVGRVSREPRSGRPSDEVLWQDPVGGTSLPRGGSIDLQVVK